MQGLRKLARGVKRDDCPQADKTQLNDSAGRITVNQVPSPPDKDTEEKKVDEEKIQTPIVARVPTPPLRDVNLIGALELFLNRFDLLEMQLNELKPIKSRGSALHCTSNINADLDTEMHNPSAMKRVYAGFLSRG